jgi:hypothetical protein
MARQLSHSSDRIWTGCLRLFSGWGKSFFSSPPLPHRYWTSLSLLPKGAQTGLSPGCRKARLWNWQHSGSAEVTKTWSCASPHPYVFIQWRLLKKRSTLPFLSMSLYINSIFFRSTTKKRKHWAPGHCILICVPGEIRRIYFGICYFLIGCIQQFTCSLWFFL